MTEGMGDQEKMIQPQDVAEAALLPLRTTGGATPKEVGLQQKVLAGSQGMVHLCLLLLSCSQSHLWPAMQITIDVTEPIK